MPRPQKRPKFWKKAKPKVCPYIFVIVSKEDWPERVTASSLRKLITERVRKKTANSFHEGTWFSSVPKIPRTKIFRVDKKRNEIALCCTVNRDSSCVLPTKPLSIQLRPI